MGLFRPKNEYWIGIWYSLQGEELKGDETDIYGYVVNGPIFTVMRKIRTFLGQDETYTTR